MTESRDQEFAAHQGNQAGDAQYDKRTGQHPVAKAFPICEAQDFLAGDRAVDPDATTDQEENRKKGDCAKQQIAAVFDQRTLAELKPRHAAVLNQYARRRRAGLRCDIAFIKAQRAPEVTVRGTAEGAERAFRGGRGIDLLSGQFRTGAVVHLQTFLTAQDVFQRRGDRCGRDSIGASLLRCGRQAEAKGEYDNKQVQKGFHAILIGRIWAGRAPHRVGGAH